MKKYRCLIQRFNLHERGHRDGANCSAYRRSDGVPAELHQQQKLINLWATGILTLTMVAARRHDRCQNRRTLRWSSRRRPLKIALAIAPSKI